MAKNHPISTQRVRTPEGAESASYDGILADGEIAGPSDEDADEESEDDESEDEDEFDDEGDEEDKADDDEESDQPEDES